MTERDEYGNPGDSFGYRESALMGGYAGKFGMFSLGGSLKLYSQAAPGNTGFGITADIGALGDLPSIEGLKMGGLRVGAVARNFIGAVKYQSGHSDPFDPVFVIGASMKPIRKPVSYTHLTLQNRAKKSHLPVRPTTLTPLKMAKSHIYGISVTAPLPTQQ